MEPIKTGHERPINKASALLLAKAPWWAHYPESAKPTVINMAAQMEWSVVIDYTKSPPLRTGQFEPQITDRRGTRIRFYDGTEGVIVGYAGAKDRDAIRTNNPKPHNWVGSWDRRRPKLKIERSHRWWVYNERGYFTMLTWNSPARRSWDVL